MKIYTFSLGCKVNTYETRALTSLFLKQGYTLGDQNHFDVALINTCAVTHVASQKSRQHIRKIRNLNKKAIIVVMGCYANENGEAIVKECDADIVLGVSNRLKVFDYINEFKKNKKKIVKVDEIKSLRKNKKYEELGVNEFNESTRAYIKISDGCDNFCSYCTIPLLRGKLRSREPKMILCEVKALIKNGYKEIVLTGIDTSSYGNEFKNYRLSDLLEDILSKNKDLYRLRLSSIEISEIDNHFLKLLKKYPNFANHLHISLQSGSDSVLKRMNRKYTSKEFLNKVNAIRKVRKDIALTTDVIVGFPGESEKEFTETYNFVKKVKFYELHVFPFSKRKGTSAYLMKDIDSQIKNERVQKLLKLNRELKKKYTKQFLNKKLDVLFEDNRTGLTSNYLRIKGNFKPNKTKKITITKNNLCN
ncbi:MAG: tRNA (N(6)-L-threonylcarbamoyladenosine(37)-C(2))-methylthiotransferase MtaB [Bacilli bacterium]|nr:tRNA (N(6)-L-threonylcarbamoyladenosine(37)-C(2))-methylthiotransferase MtaB [Bacilli bacterium]